MNKIEDDTPKYFGIEAVVYRLEASNDIRSEEISKNHNHLIFRRNESDGRQERQKHRGATSMRID